MIVFLKKKMVKLRIEVTPGHRSVREVCAHPKSPPGLDEARGG